MNEIIKIALFLWQYYLNANNNTDNMLGRLGTYVLSRVKILISKDLYKQYYLALKKNWFFCQFNMRTININ